MAATWAAVISLGVAVVLTGSTAAATAHPAALTPIIQNITQLTSNHSQENSQELVQPSLSAEDKKLPTVEKDDLEDEEDEEEGEEDGFHTGEMIADAPTPTTTTEPTPDQSLEVEKSDSLEEEDYNREMNVVSKRGGGDQEEEQEYEELPVPMAQRAAGYTLSDGTYVVKDEDGVACILAYFKCKATIYYLDTKGDYKSNLISPADDAKVAGNCDRPGQTSQVDVLWSSYKLSIRFGLDDPSDSWFVSKFSLTYNLTDPDFENVAPGGGEVTVESKKNQRYWQTSNSKSFRCLLLHDVDLKDSYNNSARLHFDEARVQAFCNSEIFRRPKHCIHRVHRDEMVPVTVGAVLAGSTLLTIVGYGIFRYFKVKKVQYDTME